MKKVLLLLTFFTASAFAQDYQLIPQDKGLTIEHPTCRLTFRIRKTREWMDTGSSYRTKKEGRNSDKTLKMKGYRYDHDGSRNENDLILRMPSLLNSIKDVVFSEYSSNSNENKEILGREYFSKNRDKGKSLLESSVDSLPNCVTTGAGVVDAVNFRKEIRDYEIGLCLNLFDGQKKSFSTKLLDNVTDKRNDRLKESTVLTEAILNCGRANDAKSRKCDISQLGLRWGISDRGYDKFLTYLERMSFEEFSRKVGDYIVQSKSCSDSSKKIKGYSQLLRNARRSF